MSNSDREFRTRIGVLERQVIEQQELIQNLLQTVETLNTITADHEQRITALENPAP